MSCREDHVSNITIPIVMISKSGGGAIEKFMTSSKKGEPFSCWYLFWVEFYSYWNTSSGVESCRLHSPKLFVENFFSVFFFCTFLNFWLSFSS